MDTKNLKQKELEETTRRWKEEDDEMEAKCKVKFGMAQIAHELN